MCDVVVTGQETYGTKRVRMVRLVAVVLVALGIPPVSTMFVNRETLWPKPVSTFSPGVRKIGSCAEASVWEVQSVTFYQ